MNSLCYDSERQEFVARLNPWLMLLVTALMINNVFFIVVAVRALIIADDVARILF